MEENDIFDLSVAKEENKFIENPSLNWVSWGKDINLSDPDGENGGLYIGVRYELNDIGRHLLRILK